MSKKNKSKNVHKNKYEQPGKLTIAQNEERLRKIKAGPMVQNRISTRDGSSYGGYSYFSY